VVRSDLALCSHCKDRNTSKKHPWCNVCRNEARILYRQRKIAKSKASGYRSGWKDCAERVVDMMQAGLSAQEIAGRL